MYRFACLPIISRHRFVRQVFKPADEEQCAPNNPRNMVGQMGSAGLRKGIPSGQGCLREVAAYLLDHKNVARVPATLRVEMFANAFHYSDANARPGPKNGSLQVSNRFMGLISSFFMRY